MNGCQIVDQSKRNRSGGFYLVVDVDLFVDLLLFFFRPGYPDLMKSKISAAHFKARGFTRDAVAAAKKGKRARAVADAAKAHDEGRYFGFVEELAERNPLSHASSGGVQDYCKGKGRRQARYFALQGDSLPAYDRAIQDKDRDVGAADVDALNESAFCGLQTKGQCKGYRQPPGKQ